MTHRRKRRTDSGLRGTGPYDPGMTTGRSGITPAIINDAVTQAFPGAEQVTCADVGRDFALARRDIDPDSARPGGLVPGPSQFAIADAALWFLTFGVIDGIELMALTSEMDISFLRPASGAVIWARAQLLSAGNRRIVGSVKVWCDDREQAPSSVAKGTYVLPR